MDGRIQHVMHRYHAAGACLVSLDYDRMKTVVPSISGFRAC
jgi:hypothetical protein